ncbi:MAG TPA: c-type cytochrome domain-containing protein [Acetobacteraceae bacterium]|nr:c-type cytochrome domain-containing protein [Acetobacteraceae bacterium]
MTNRYAAALSIALAAGALAGFGLLAPVHPARADEQMSFKDDVQPIFKLYCVSCHSAPNGEGYKVSGLSLTTYQGVMKGTKYGPMIVPGNADYSNLMWLLDWKASPQLRMPHGKKQLPVGERNIIRAWINQGAKDN